MAGKTKGKAQGCIGRINGGKEQSASVDVRLSNAYIPDRELGRPDASRRPQVQEQVIEGHEEVSQSAS